MEVENNKIAITAIQADPGATENGDPVATSDLAIGQPADPDNPKASEGLEAFREQVYSAIDAAGWNEYTTESAAYNFVITELFNTRVICQNTRDAKFYDIPISVGGDGEVSLGEPKECDITYTPAANPDADTVGAPAATNGTDAVMMADGSSQARLRSRAMPIRMEVVEDKPGVYRILICNSGFAKKWTRVGTKQLQMYISPESLVDAVKEGRFDGGRCFWRHPDANYEESGKPKRERLLSGYIVPKTVEIVKNLAGGVDVWGHYDTIDTTDGIGIKAIIAKQAELRRIGLDITLIENSIFSEDATWRVGNIEGVDVLKLEKLNRRVDVDFVDEGAMPRSSVRGRIAAAATPQSKEGLTMTEKEELEGLRKTAVELSAKVRRMELETEVDKSLGESGLPEDRCKLLRPILLSIENTDVRTASLEMSKQDYWRAAKPSAKSGGASDNAAPATPKPLRADVQAAVDKAAKAAGLTAEQIAKAQMEVLGAAE